MTVHGGGHVLGGAADVQRARDEGHAEEVLPGGRVLHPGSSIERLSTFLSFFITLKP